MQFIDCESTAIEYFIEIKIMKKINFLILLITCLSLQLNAQQLRSDKNIFLQTGVINSGFNVAAGFEKLFGENKNYGLNISLNVHQLDQTAESVSITAEESSFFLHVSGRRYFMTDNLNHLHPYVGLGVLGGYSHLSGGSSGMYNMLAENSFLYGASSQVGAEYNFSKFTLFLEGAYLFTGEHYGRANMGIKYYL